LGVHQHIFNKDGVVLQTASPGDVGQRFIDECLHDVHVFLEHLAAVGLKAADAFKTGIVSTELNVSGASA